MKNKIHLSFCLIVLMALPSFAETNGKFTKRKFGAYEVSLSQSFASGISKIVIKKGSKIVFEDSGVDDHYYFGNEFDDTLNGKDTYSGHDITGNGHANLVISNWTGGAHCCHFLSIFEIGKEFKKIATVDAKSSSIRLIDLDGDRFPEIEFYDGAIDYQFSSFASSPGGRVVLKFKKDRYDVATGLMARAAPTSVQLKMIKRKMQIAFKEKNPDLSYEFLRPMMDLSYSGHFDLALKLADESWPSQKEGLQKFKQEFSQALHDSSYWRKF